MGQPVKFYTDEHAARAVVRGLRHRGVDVLTVPEAGLLGASDEEHLERARAEGRVVFTQDEDSLRLLAVGAAHAGIAYEARDFDRRHHPRVDADLSGVGNGRHERPCRVPVVVSLGRTTCAR